MTPKAKAKKLFNTFYQLSESIEWTTDETIKQKAGEYNEELGPEVEKFWHEHSKRCALIAVDEIINEYWSHHNNNRVYWWEEVKQEIEKL